jgi:hypothetical protein
VDIGVRAGLRDRGQQRIDQFAGQRIAPVGAIERDPGDALVLVQQDGG